MQSVGSCVVFPESPFQYNFIVAILLKLRTPKYSPWHIILNTYAFLSGSCKTVVLNLCETAVPENYFFIRREPGIIDGRARYRTVARRLRNNVKDARFHYYMGNA
jgi:hypothetical protein